MQNKPRQHGTSQPAPARSSDVLDVHGAAALLTVSIDTVYRLFNKGELPGRKVGRKWLTTKAAVLRWIEASSANDTLGRAIEGGNADALKNAFNKGMVRVKGK